MNPLVSIIVPCYNQAQYLDEALQSVLNQTYLNWECIIVNDGGSDNTENVSNEWIKKDKRFIYLYKENGGLSSARNAGILNAKGEYILPLDADDKINFKYIDLAIKSFKNDDSLKIVYCRAQNFGILDGLWQLPPFSIYDLCRFNMIFCSALFKKEDWKLVGGYDINMIYGLEDWEFWIAILKNGGKVKCLEEIGFYYRIRENSMARTISQEEREFSERYVAKKHFEFYRANYNHLNENTKIIQRSLKSEKFIFNLFTQKFFGFKFFKGIDNNFTNDLR